MARRSSARSSSPSRAAPMRTQTAPAARTAAGPPAPAQSGGFMGSTKHVNSLLHNLFLDIASNIVGGMASGVGFSVANRVVDSVMGPRQMEMVHTQAESPAQQAVPAQVAQPINTSNLCQVQQEQLNQCLSQAGDMSHCSYYFENLKQCQVTSRT